MCITLALGGTGSVFATSSFLARAGDLALLSSTSAMSLILPIDTGDFSSEGGVLTMAVLPDSSSFAFGRRFVIKFKNSLASRIPRRIVKSEPFTDAVMFLRKSVRATSMSTSNG